MPDVDYLEFQIHSFSSIIELDAEAFYSPSFYLNGLEWRLKLYAENTIKTPLEEDVNYLSVFLELTSSIYDSSSSGLNFEPSEYTYQITLVSHNGGKDLKREYTCKYDIGECWGYHRFLALPKLSEDGYWDQENDSVIFRFRVMNANGYPGYVEDLKRYVKYLEARDVMLTELEEQNQSSGIVRKVRKLETVGELEEEVYEEFSEDQEAEVSRGSEEPLTGQQSPLDDQLLSAIQGISIKDLPKEEEEVVSEVEVVADPTDVERLGESSEEEEFLSDAGELLQETEEPGED